MAKIYLTKEEISSKIFYWKDLENTKHPTKFIGIYLITHLPSGLKYVGSSKHITQRWKQHIATAKRKSEKYNYKIHNYIKKYGPQNFSFSVLELVDDSQQLRKIEQIWIDKLDVYKNGLNSTYTSGEVFGYEWTLKDKEKVSKISKEQVEEIRTLRRSGQSNKSLSERFKLHRTTITRICAGESWEEINNPMSKQELKLLRVSKKPKLSREEVELGRRLKMAKITPEIIENIRIDYGSGLSFPEIAIKYNRTVQTAKRIATGEKFPEFPLHERKLKPKHIRRNVELRRIIKAEILSGASEKTILNKYGLAEPNYYRVKRGERWKDV